MYQNISGRGGIFWDKGNDFEMKILKSSGITKINKSAGNLNFPKSTLSKIYTLKIYTFLNPCLCLHFLTLTNLTLNLCVNQKQKNQSWRRPETCLLYTTRPSLFVYNIKHLLSRYFINGQCYLRHDCLENKAQMSIPRDQFW